MMTAEEIRKLALGIRARTNAVDDDMVDMIKWDVEEYREFLADPRPQLPPAEIAEHLPLMGWLIYEASIEQLWAVAPAFESLRGEKGKESRTAAELIMRLANAARRLPWPEFAPRALGAIRAHALVESKRDSEIGYDTAWIVHEEARTKHASYVDSHGNDPALRRYVLDLDEVMLQLALAETGTACRTAERVLGLWAEELETSKPAWTEKDSARWTQRMFRQLSEGAAIGEHALSAAERIKERGFTFHVDENRMALPTAFRNPAIMTCRALLLMYSMCPEMEALGRDPAKFDSWSKFQSDLIRRFDKAFNYLRQPVKKEDGNDWPLLFDHRRSMVQICLHLALLTPGHDLKKDLVADQDLTLRVLDDAAVEAMSTWLADIIDGKQRGDANTIGSTSKPSFIASVEACRKDPGASANYREWRRRWFKLDRYADWPGRRQRIEAILGSESRLT